MRLWDADGRALESLTGHTDVTDVSGLGLDRFDEQGRSKLAPDPIALPFPGELPAFPGTGAVP